MQARTASTFANSQFFNLPNNDSEVTLGPSIGGEEVQEMLEWMEVVRFMGYESQVRKVNIAQREKAISQIAVEIAELEESIKKKKEIMKQKDERFKKQSNRLKIKRRKQ